MSLVSTSVDFARHCSLHGVRYIADSSLTLIERIVWVLIIFISLTFSVYLTFLFWARYIDNPTRTIIDTNAASTITVPFPGVTICNMNEILEVKVRKFLEKLEANGYELMVTRNVISKMVFNELSHEESRFEFNTSEVQMAQDVLMQNGYADIQTVLIQISQSCDEMILRCSLNKKQLPCRDLFEQTFTTDGRCCSFNYVSKRSLKRPFYTLYYGMFTGLTIVLVPAYNSRSTAGVTVIIHDPMEFPNGDENLKNSLRLGHSNYLQVQASKRKCSTDVRGLAFKNRQCIFPDERALEYFQKYTYSNCLTLCDALISLDRCRCIPHYYEFMRERAVCNPQDFACLDNITDGSSDDNCDCPSQCEEEFYDVKLATTKLNIDTNAWALDYLRGFNDTENLILLNVFFSTNHQTVWLRDTVTSGIYLVSSFGGIYSLFLGCSVITLIEILYFFIVKGVLNKCSHKELGKAEEREVSRVFTFHRVGISTKISQSENFSSPILPFTN